MNRKIQLAALLLLGAAVLTFSIRAGMAHQQCRECKLGMSGK